MSRRSSEVVKQTTDTLGALWELPHLAESVTVSFSARLTRSLGRSIPARGIVRLHPDLEVAPLRVVREVLCHELAHVAEWRQSEGKGRPHGPAWAALVQKAGFTPGTCLRIPTTRPSVTPTRRRYIHECPVCHVQRIAGRRVGRWRCARCLDVGLPGQLTIRRVR